MTILFSFQEGNGHLLLMQSLARFKRMAVADVARRLNKNFFGGKRLRRIRKWEIEEDAKGVRRRRRRLYG